MKIIQLQIYLFMWYEATESLTYTSVTLGADVIITCELDIKNIYWYKQNYPDLPVLILRTYSSTFEDGDIFEPKYSVKTNSSLFIRNISTDELAVYYCVKTSEPQKISSGTKLYIFNIGQENITDSINRNQVESHMTPCQYLTITSISVNVLLTVALIGMVKILLEVTKKSTVIQNSHHPQFAETSFSMCPSNTRPCPEQSTAVFYTENK